MFGSEPRTKLSVHFLLVERFNKQSKGGEKEKMFNITYEWQNVRHNT